MNKLMIDFLLGVERIAWSMPAPNPYTPQLLQLCVKVRDQQAKDQQHKHTVHGERAPSIGDAPVTVDTTKQSGNYDPDNQANWSDERVRREVARQQQQLALQSKTSGDKA